MTTTLKYRRAGCEAAATVMDQELTVCVEVECSLTKYVNYQNILITRTHRFQQNIFAVYLYRELVCCCIMGIVGVIFLKIDALLKIDGINIVWVTRGKASNHELSLHRAHRSYYLDCPLVVGCSTGHKPHLLHVSG